VGEVEEGERGAPMARREAGPRTRLSGQKRERFLEMLGQTRNRRLAAEAIGVEPRLMDQRREFDPLLDRQWREAVAQADRRLAGASGPLDCIGGAEPMVIRRGPKGKLRIVKAGPRRWSRPVEERFFAALAATGNIAASARAVGFSVSCIWQRRRQWPAFARRIEEALEDAEVELEFRMVEALAGTPAAAEYGDSYVTVPDEGQLRNCPPDGGRALDMDAALRFLKWREEKRRGGGRRDHRRTRGLPDRTLDEAVESILGKIEAVERHEARERRREAEPRGEADLRG
jgi:hypothetical protein